MASSMAIRPRSCAGNEESPPLNAPMGVRAAEAMTISFILVTPSGMRLHSAVAHVIC